MEIDEVDNVQLLKKEKGNYSAKGRRQKDKKMEKETRNREIMWGREQERRSSQRCRERASLTEKRGKLT